MLQGTTKAKNALRKNHASFPLPLSTYYCLFSSYPVQVTGPNILKAELRANSPAVSHPLLFVIWRSLGSEQWLPNFAFQWLFIILIVDLTAFDVIDFKRLFGGEKKKKTTLFFLGPLQYSVLIWILSLPFLCLPLFLLGVAICSGSGLGGLCPGESRSLHASHTGLLFSFSITYSHLSPYSFYWSPCFWFPMSLPKTLLCLQRSPEQRAWASCIPTNKQMKYKPTLASAFPNCWSCNLRSSLAERYSYLFFSFHQEFIFSSVAFKKFSPSIKTWLKGTSFKNLSLVTSIKNDPSLPGSVFRTSFYRHCSQFGSLKTSMRL